MKMCMPHWDALKVAIEERSLMKFVANDGHGAAEKLTNQLQPGAAELDKFEPLLGANFAIFSNALDRGGLYLMGAKEDGTPYCPLCEVEKNTDIKAETWITYAADEQLEKARRLGLLPGEVNA